MIMILEFIMVIHDGVKTMSRHFISRLQVLQNPDANLVTAVGTGDHKYPALAFFNGHQYILKFILTLYFFVAKALKGLSPFDLAF